MDETSGRDSVESCGQEDSILSFKNETKKVLETFLRRSLSMPEETAVGRVGGCYHTDYDHRRQRQRQQSNGLIAKSGRGSGSAPTSVPHDAVEVDPDWTEVHEKINDAEEKKHGFKTLFKKFFRVRRSHKRKEPFEVSLATASTFPAKAVICGVKETDGGSPSSPASEETPTFSVRSKSKQKKKKQGLQFFSLKRKSKEDRGSPASDKASRRPSTLPLENISQPSKRKEPSIGKHDAEVAQSEESYEKVARRLERLANQHQQRSAQSPEADSPSASRKGEPIIAESETFNDGWRGKPEPLPPCATPEAKRGLKERTSPGKHWPWPHDKRKPQIWLDEQIEVAKGGFTGPNKSRTPSPQRAQSLVLRRSTRVKLDDKAPAPVAPVNKEALIEELVQLLISNGDNIDLKIKENPPLREALDRMSYPAFRSLTNAFITAETTDTTPGREASHWVQVSDAVTTAASAAATPDAADAASPDGTADVVVQQLAPSGSVSPQQPEVLQIALAMDLTKRVAVINRRAVTRIMGFGAQYLEERFSQWILQQGGWHNIIDPDNISEFEVD